MAQNPTPILLIVGLGNPGDEYRSTRHNIGFQFLDRLAARENVRFLPQARFFGELARIQAKSGDVRLLKPTTYMNLSGSAVQALAGYFKIKPEEILVVHDELDLPPGAMRLKLGGGNAGHNGLKDITAKLGTPNFWRLRVGIGHPRQFCPQQAVFDWVLGTPSAEHQEAIDGCLDAALKWVDGFASGNFERINRALLKFSRPAGEAKGPAREGRQSAGAAGGAKNDGNSPAAPGPDSPSGSGA